MKQRHAHLHVADLGRSIGSCSKLFAAPATPVTAAPAAVGATPTVRGRSIGSAVIPASSRC